MKEDFGDRPFEERLLMEGMSNKSPEELVPLAKSWLDPAELEVKSGCTSEGYDRAQRALSPDCHRSGDFCGLGGFRRQPDG